MKESWDFKGWATRNNVRCTDGRTIRKDAFKENDGGRVPLVWMHIHDDPATVLGHAILENREEGVYAYCSFNDTENGKVAKELVTHGDVNSMSIWANQLKQHGDDVLHGVIREVSLVMAGANPEAYIEKVMAHSDDPMSEGIMYFAQPLVLSHSDTTEAPEDNSDTDETVGTVLDTLSDKQKRAVDALVEEAIRLHDEEKDTVEHADQSGDEDGETVGDVLNTLNPEQKAVADFLMEGKLPASGKPFTKEEVLNVIRTLSEKQQSALAYVLNDDDADDNNDDNEEEDSEMKHNVFDNDARQANDTLSHDEMSTIFADAKKLGSLKDSVLAHSEEYGIGNIEYLFPDAKTLNNQPEFIKRDTGWVSAVMNGVHHSPFSRVKSVFANITEDEARAKGYIKGNLKKEEFFTLIKRTTEPRTIYKKQKIDRDDWNDITDFDAVAWMKTEMRMMLDEELARAILVSDGRLASSDDKINEQNIRPIYKDEDLFTIKRDIKVASNATDDDKARAFIRDVVKSRKDYKGSGNPDLWTTDDMLTSCLLLTDSTGRDIYSDEAQLAKKLRVRKIITVPVMEGVKGAHGGELLGILVNLSDYNVGADKGGAVNMFDDFDIDYNQQKLLMETRCSGALTKPYSAIAYELTTA